MVEQWNVRVKILELDRGEVHQKNRWNKGDTITVQIEPHATVGMLKQRIALIVAAHEKWQKIQALGGAELDPAARLNSIEGLTDGGTVNLIAKAPVVAEEELGELSDDPDAIEPEEAAPPGLPDDALMTKELTEDEEDKQNAAKGAAAELLEDGEKAKALEKLTEAIMIGNPNAMVLCRRADLLLKMKRPCAAILDATAALSKNPDSAKAYKIRGKANRLLSKWTEAVQDFAQCQAIDYDDDIKPLHEYCTKRKTWYMKKEAKDKKAAEAAEKAEK